MARREVLAYLESVADLYPGGIPPAAVQQSPRNAEKYRCVIVSDAAELQSNATLVRSIIEKGMQLKSNEVALVSAAGELKDLQPSRIVSFGENGLKLVRAAGLAPKRWIKAAALSTIASDQAAKRGFWEELKRGI
ncbi:MAG: hypothetical protein K1X83_05085 [Oligoflexia bacterium]|nr:hypothetical protein [Oligoflexia bacterium]